MEPEETRSTSSGRLAAVSAEEFFKVDLRVGKVEEAILLDNSDKLIRLIVDFQAEKRTILAGLKPFFDPDFFLGKMFVFAYNLAPRKMAGMISQGMMLCADNESGPKPLAAPEGSREGDKLR
ncbi:MAG: methionine--tRNA ligase [Candidatus Blackburnbacteria bacterium]|nr:methionine--tRNA ligase [Candidatus Blackburnbacteria bacterium]